MPGTLDSLDVKRCCFLRWSESVPAKVVPLCLNTFWRLLLWPRSCSPWSSDLCQVVATQYGAVSWDERHVIFPGIWEICYHFYQIFPDSLDVYLLGSFAGPDLRWWAATISFGNPWDQDACYPHCSCAVCFPHHWLQTIGFADRPVAVWNSYFSKWYCLSRQVMLQHLWVEPLQRRFCKGWWREELSSFHFWVRCAFWSLWQRLDSANRMLTDRLGCGKKYCSFVQRSVDEIQVSHELKFERIESFFRLDGDQSWFLLLCSMCHWSVGQNLHAFLDCPRSFFVFEINVSKRDCDLTIFLSYPRSHSLIFRVHWNYRKPLHDVNVCVFILFNGAMKFACALLVVCMAGRLFAAVDALSDEEVGVPASVDSGLQSSKRKRRRLTKEFKPSKELDPVAQLPTILGHDCPCKQKTCSRQFLEPTMLAELGQYVREWHSLDKLDQDRIVPYVSNSNFLYPKRLQSVFGFGSDLDLPLEFDFCQTYLRHSTGSKSWLPNLGMIFTRPGHCCAWMFARKLGFDCIPWVPRSVVPTKGFVICLIPNGWSWNFFWVGFARARARPRVSFFEPIKARARAREPNLFFFS